MKRKHHKLRRNQKKVDKGKDIKSKRLLKSELSRED